MPLLSPCSFEVPKHFQSGIPFDLQCLSLSGRGFALAGFPILHGGVWEKMGEASPLVQLEKLGCQGAVSGGLEVALLGLLCSRGLGLLPLMTPSMSKSLYMAMVGVNRFLP